MLLLDARRCSEWPATFNALAQKRFLFNLAEHASAVSDILNACYIMAASESSVDDTVLMCPTVWRNDMKTTCAAIALTLAAIPALSQNVKVTPIGSHPGELCANDRAI